MSIAKQNLQSRDAATQGKYVLASKLARIFTFSREVNRDVLIRTEIIPLFGTCSSGTNSPRADFSNDNQSIVENDMSVKGQIKEAAGYTKEEAYEHGKSAESQEKAQEGRNLRNEGRVEDGKAPKTSTPGTQK